MLLFTLSSLCGIYPDSFVKYLYHIYKYVFVTKFSSFCFTIDHSLPVRFLYHRVSIFLQESWKQFELQSISCWLGTDKLPVWQMINCMPHLQSEYKCIFSKKGVKYSSAHWSMNHRMYTRIHTYTHTHTNLYIQSSAVITRSNLSRYYIRHCDVKKNKILESQQTPHISPSQASYGVSIVRIWAKIHCVITAPRCIYIWISEAIMIYLVLKNTLLSMK